MLHLWQYFLEDDLDAFRHLLANATFNVGSLKGTGSHGAHKAGSPVVPSTSSRTTFMRNRRSLENTSKAVVSFGKQDQRLHQVNLTRAGVNAKDAYGRTLLHLAAASSSVKALGFVEALLQIPFIDLYVQDLESGWTPLHRALYHGHVSIAQALMLRDINDLTNYTTNVAHHLAGGLIKIKDHEGNTPFEVFSLTIASRDLQHSSPAIPTLSQEDTNSVNSADTDDLDTTDRASRRVMKPRFNLLGDEVFAFGSNKNLSLGLGHEDDRQFPEQIVFNRPQQLLRRLQVDAQARRSMEFEIQDSHSGHTMAEPIHALPAISRNQPMVIQDVVMSKLHTAVITNDPECNVFVCGFGPGGRLGTGDESTRFNYVCLEAAGFSKKHVVVIALGQDHSIAVCEQGDAFTWGSNRFGQLGYSLPQSSSIAKDNPVQLTPRQLFGSMKKETIRGAAASSFHSVVFTSTALYTFGKNEGQLGLMDADARSLETQVVPRRVGVSILQSPILMVSAIDRATTILLESHEVVVLTHYGWAKLIFQLEGFTNYFLHCSSATRYDPAGNFISKITSGSNTICAMSAFGELFTVDVSRKPDHLATNQSTTNPSKARNALPQPSKLWSIGKPHMAARDVAVGHNGSIVLCTVSGSVWRKEKRAKIKEESAKRSSARMKDYKFTRIPNINRAVGVRSNAYGAYTAIRKDCDVMRQQIIVDGRSLWNDMFTMLPFRDLACVNDEDSDAENPRPRFWTPVTSATSPASVKQAILQSSDIESQMEGLMQRYQPLSDSQYDLWITSAASNFRIPVHSFLVKARSLVLRQALTEFQKCYYYSVPGIISIEYGPDGHIHLLFQRADSLSLLSFVLYLYTEEIVDFWHYNQRRPQMASRYRQIRSELIKIAGSLDMRCLERAARVMTEPTRCLHLDMESAFKDPAFFTDADVKIDLANDAEVAAHSSLLSHRCPFFGGLFNGRAGGSWLSSRRKRAEEILDPVRVDLKHVEEQIFGMVLRHIYADTGEELFDDVVIAGLDEFIDIILEVMSVSSELMLDRLTQITQKMLGRYVTTRNVCQLLNAVAPCSVTEFKHAGLEYVCLNLEAMLEQRLLEELDDDLLWELDEMVQENQRACLPFARSGRAEAELFEQHPELVAQIELGRHGTIDSLRPRRRILESEDQVKSAPNIRAKGSEPSDLKLRSLTTDQPMTGDSRATATSQASKPLTHGSDMLFEMDEERLADESTASLFTSPDGENEAALDSASTLPHQYHGLHQRESLASSKSKSRAALSVGASLQVGSVSSTILEKNSGDAIQSPACPEIYSKVWHGPLAGSAKADFKDIMAQASASRTSNLTLAINNKDTQLGKAPQKLSQRERKKMQHQQSRERVSSPSRGVLAGSASSLPPSSPRSPWQTIQRTSAPSTPQIKGPHESATPLSSRPAMTMRQTLAGAPAGPKAISLAKPEPHPRSVPTPITGQSPNPLAQVQSIRHTPTTPAVSNSPSGAHHSMAHILAQQQGEKTAIKEAAAKRSLQEIQQEQEFQEWWDSESRRVQEEEQASTASTATASNRGRGRGRRRKGDSHVGGRSSGIEIDARIVHADAPRRAHDGVGGTSQRTGGGQRGERRRSRGH